MRTSDAGLTTYISPYGLNGKPTVARISLVSRKEPRRRADPRFKRPGEDQRNPESSAHTHTHTHTRTHSRVKHRRCGFDGSAAANPSFIDRLWSIVSCRSEERRRVWIRAEWKLMTSQITSRGRGGGMTLKLSEDVFMKRLVVFLLWCETRY